MRFNANLIQNGLGAVWRDHVRSLEIGLYGNGSQPLNIALIDIDDYCQQLGNTEHRPIKKYL